MLSVSVLTQTPPQSVCPAGQAQAPATQLWPPMHATPQPPQLALSVKRFASQPSDCRWLQSPVLVAHATMMHDPALQPLVTTLLPVHLVPHDPQFAGSLDVLAQYAEGAVPQVVRGAPQVAVQAPIEHT